MILRQVRSALAAFAALAAVFAAFHAPVCAAQTETEADSNVGAYPLDFLTVGVGARAAGMGNAHTALAEDATAAYWNPAGLAGIQNGAFASQHADMFQQQPGGFPLGRGLAQYNALTGAVPFEGGVIALSWIRLGVDDIPRVTFIDVNGDGILGTFSDLNQNGVKDDGERYIDQPVVAEKFSAADDAFFISYARRLHRRMDAGGTLKIFRQSLLNAQGSGAGFDLGAAVRIHPRLRAALLLQDLFGSRINWDTATRPVFVKPTNPRLGLAGNLPVHRHLLLTAAADLSLNDSIRRSSERGASPLHAGVELTVIDAVSFRFGLDAGDLTIGAGAKVPIENFFLFADYAFMTHPDLGDAQRVSLSGAF